MWTLKWLTIGIGIKRWILLLAVANVSLALAFASLYLRFQSGLQVNPFGLSLLVMASVVASIVALFRLSQNLLAPYRRHQHGRVVDVVYAHSRRHKGFKVVAIGGGTGLPSVLRGLKAHTSNITAVVTVADDGGSSGRLRRELGVLPPGDLRSNIVALADDESLMAKLFQHRFDTGDLGGHSFGNLFIAALAGVSGGIEHALPEIERVLNIQGRVLPATLDDVNLVANVRLKDRKRVLRVQGESKISELNGQIEDLAILPSEAIAYTESIQAILDADLVVIGPGSLYTSILPNLLVKGIAKALKQTRAIKVYVCNVATQPGETEGYSVADHVIAIERYLGRGVLQAVVANNATPPANQNTHYVPLIPSDHELFQRYSVYFTDLTDPERPWRHDAQKLSMALLKLLENERVGSPNENAVLPVAHTLD